MRTRRRSEPLLIGALGFMAGLLFRGKRGWSMLGGMLFAGWLAWSVAVAWWSGLHPAQRSLLVLLLVAGVGLLVWRWADRRFGGAWVPGSQQLRPAGPKPPRRRRPQLEGEPPRVLYRWYEPDDLPPGLVCFCGQPRVAGELVYIGKTNIARSRELDDDRQQSCWWQSGGEQLEGTTKLYGSEAEVLAAEALAIGREHPRENKVHNGARLW